jgi:ribosomal protein S18 acetylase RimI-like enzyme
MGIGARTVRIAEGILKENGTESVRLDAFSQNPCALSLYGKLGYYKVGNIYYRKGLFYLYEKIL